MPRANLLLLLTAVIWGFAFVAQRVGMEHVGPFLFNAIRFALGGVFLLVVLWIQGPTKVEANGSYRLFSGGLIAGCFLFCGASLQQVGIVYTTAGKAGFITGLYVILVPLVGIFMGQRTDRNTWLGAILAAIGLYFLSVTEALTIQRGDFLELVGALFWAAHVHIVGWYAKRTANLPFSIIQFFVCSVFSFCVALGFEQNSFEGIVQATVPILYGGVFSVGVGYTLQVIGQKNAHPSHAAIILSLEAVFAAIGGMMLLSETLTGRSLLGCLLMLSGMIFSQIPSERACESSPT
ncbi:MAG: DMT family transporter [Candidatus Ozemobacteraceae bacterium]